jgi:hypothetical protein
VGALAVVGVYAFNREWLLCLFGEDAGNVVGELALAIVSTFIVYFVVDVLRRRREYDAIAPYIGRYINLLTGDAVAVCREAAASGGITLSATWTLTEDEVMRIFSVARLLGPANMIFPNGSPATLLDYLLDRAVRSRRWLAALLQFTAFLGGEGLSRVADIQDGAYFGQLDNLILGISGQMRLKDRDLSFLANLFVRHYRSIERLRTWANREGIA